MDDTPKKPAAFDPARFRMGTTSSKDPVARKVVTLVRVNKAAKQQFVRTRAGDGWRTECAVVHLAGEDRPYIVDPSVAHLVAHDMKHVQLRLSGSTDKAICSFGLSLCRRRKGQKTHGTRVNAKSPTWPRSAGSG